MAAADPDSLPGIFRDVVRVLEHDQIPYLIIGGVAQAVIGEPRMTQDVDCIVAVQTDQIAGLLNSLAAEGFEADPKIIRERVDSTGTFSVQRGRWHVDVILASTEFEQSAFKRAQRIRLYDLDVNLPTPEDLILLKLVPGRDKDLLDVRTVMMRHRQQLDVSYLEQWAQRLSDASEDSRIWETLQRLLNETSASA